MQIPKRMHTLLSLPSVQAVEVDGDGAWLYTAKGWRNPEEPHETYPLHTYHESNGTQLVKRFNDNAPIPCKCERCIG